MSSVEVSLGTFGRKIYETKADVDAISEVHSGRRARRTNLLNSINPKIQQNKEQSALSTKIVFTHCIYF